MAKVFCTHCGAANPEESAFCEQCGQALKKPQEVEQQEESYQEPQGKKGGGKKWIIPIVIILVLALAGGGAYMYHKQQEAEKAEKAKLAEEKAEAEKTIPIDLASLMTTPQITGEDGSGVVSAEPVVDGNKSTTILNSINEKKKEDMGKFLNSVKYTAAPNEGLSNGDKVKIQIDYDKELAAKLNLEISGTSSEIKVKGLKAVEAFIGAQVSDAKGVRFTKVSLDGPVASNKGFDAPGDVTSGADLTISVGSKSATYDYIVPNSAIKSDTNGTFVLTVEAKSSPLGNRYIARRVAVEVLAADDSNSAVTGNFGYGSYVITTSNAPVKNGDLVRLADNG